jgi:hypothetical protein
MQHLAGSRRINGQVGEMRKAYKILIDKTVGEYHRGDPDIELFPCSSLH